MFSNDKLQVADFAHRLYGFELCFYKDITLGPNSIPKASSRGEDYPSLYKQTTGPFSKQCETLTHSYNSNIVLMRKFPPPHTELALIGVEMFMNASGVIINYESLIFAFMLL